MEGTYNTYCQEQKDYLVLVPLVFPACSSQSRLSAPLSLSEHYLPWLLQIPHELEAMKKTARQIKAIKSSGNNFI